MCFYENKRVFSISWDREKLRRLLKIFQKDATHEYKKRMGYENQFPTLQGPVFKSTDHSASSDKSPCRCYAKLPYRCSVTSGGPVHPSEGSTAAHQTRDEQPNYRHNCTSTQITCRQTFDTSGPRTRARVPVSGISI